MSRLTHRQHLYSGGIELERYCRPSRTERLARYVLIVACLCGIAAAVALAMGYLPNSIGDWPR